MTETMMQDKPKQKIKPLHSHEVEKEMMSSDDESVIE